MKKILITLMIISVLLVSIGFVVAKPAGYNMDARIFVGTGMQYCEQHSKLRITDKDACEAEIEEDPDDHLVMKWSQAWHMAVFGPDNIRGGSDTLSWSDAVDQYGSAWVNNQWNGMFPGGSGERYNSKIIWTGVSCGPNYEPLPNGGQCIWGQFNIIHKQGTGPSGHYWDAHAIPSGYGA